jgi:hypothetical protein
MPTDIPYFGHHTNGDEYGPCAFVCDGFQYLEAEMGVVSGFVIEVDDHGGPIESDLTRVKVFCTLAKRVQAIFKDLATESGSGQQTS